MSERTERNCDKCIHHTSGNCDSWDCNMQTVEDVKKEAVNEYMKVVVEELEELKFLRQWKSDVMDEFCKYDCNSVEEARNNGYNKAIDDFVNACKENILCQTFGLHINGIERIAEQLKAGGENENYNKEES